MTEKKYAELLLDYCLEIKSGQSLFIRSTLLAEPLIREIYREGIKRGANIVVDMAFSEQGKIFMDHANDEQLAFVQPNFIEAMETYDAYLFIKAHFNLRADQNIDGEKRKRRSEFLKKYNDIYFERTGSGDMVRSLCLYPTQASAQEAGMSLEEYRDFVFKACKLDAENPAEEWRKVRKNQQAIVDFLNASSRIKYVNDRTDISFSVEGRTWINSDGRTNMPSGEVFTGPVEESVSGQVYFNYPSIYQGKEVRGITLHVENGVVVSWDADQGKEVLDQVMSHDGARMFGEVAIGTNYKIQQATKNILFDEKIGGTIHMAIGQSYKQTGGKNNSSIHWDMITDMKNGGKIYADDELIYENGYFINYKL